MKMTLDHETTILMGFDTIEIHLVYSFDSLINTRSKNEASKVSNDMVDAGKNSMDKIKLIIA